MILRLIVSILIIGILASYYNFGFISVFFSVFLPAIFLLNIVCALIGIFTKKYINVIGVLFFVVFFDFFIQFNTKNKEPREEQNFSILSYNVRGFNKDYDIEDDKIATKILDFIRATDSDILLLQESSYKESRGIKYPYEFLGFQEGKEKSLLAIYSKHPILNTGYIDFPDTRNNGIYADIKIHNDTIRLYNIHLQSFQIQINSSINQFSMLKKLNDGFSKQIQQAKQVKKAINKNDKYTIIGGDFNTTPFTLPYRILKKDLKDSFITRGNGLGTTYSLFNYPLRLDYFLVDEKIRIIEHKNFNLKFSDHEPILTTLLIE